MKIGVTFILFMLIILLSPSISFAKTNEDTSLFIYSIEGTTNTYVDLDATVGEEVSFSIVLYNSGTTRKTNTLFISDGHTANNGGTMVLTPEEATREKTGSWFNITEEEVTLDPGEKKVFDFVVSVPQNITSGTHVAVIYLRSPIVSGVESEANKKGSSFKINETYSLSSAVIIRVGEETIHNFIIQENMEEKWIKNRDKVLSFYIANTGNTYSYPNANISIYNNDQLVYEVDEKLDIVYPDNTCRIDFLIPPDLYTQDTYNVILSLEYGKEEIKSISREFTLCLKSKEINTALKEIVKEEQKKYNGIILTEQLLHKIIISVFSVIIIVLLLTGFLRKKKTASKDYLIHNSFVS